MAMLFGGEKGNLSSVASGLRLRQIVGYTYLESPFRAVNEAFRGPNEGNWPILSIHAFDISVTTKLSPPHFNAFS
jgi:hypothetical protein